MRIDAARTDNSALVRLEGRLDREGAEHLSDTLEDLVRAGVRSLRIDFDGVSYVSSAATEVLVRWHEELSVLRGELRLTSLTPVVREGFAVAGWDSRLDSPDGVGSGGSALRQSSWHSRGALASSGQYEWATSVPTGALTCRLHGDPSQLTRAPFGPGDCSAVGLPDSVFGLGLGAIGGRYEECQERLGELLAVKGCVAHFPSDGARMADYIVCGGDSAPHAVLATGMTCEGSFSQLVRFTTQPQAEEVPLSELANVSLEAVGGRLAGLVIVGETAGLCGARLRRSPGAGPTPVPFELPGVRDWLSFPPERIYPRTTTLMVGVAARGPKGPIAAHLRPLGQTGRLFGHFHVAVFSYRPLPQRTVELTELLRSLFVDHSLRDVLHLVSDDRGDAGVKESAFLRGVGWVAPITEVC